MKILRTAVKLRLEPISKTGESVCSEASLGGRSAAAAKTDSKAGPQKTCFTLHDSGLRRCLAIVIVTGMMVSADGVPTVVTYVPHDKVTEVMAKGGSIINDKGLIVLAQRRSAGEVEVHEKTSHVFIIVEGEATLVTGGTLVGAKDTAPGQRRAPSVTGGDVHHLSKGDVITIPAKTPHWFKDVPTGTIAYYAVNTEP
jgi:mannose-6-phosphate isomerase-like protein (cupin superfamily)